MDFQQFLKNLKAARTEQREDVEEKIDEVVPDQSTDSFVDESSINALSEATSDSSVSSTDENDSEYETSSNEEGSENVTFSDEEGSDSDVKEDILDSLKSKLLSEKDSDQNSMMMMDRSDHIEPVLSADDEAMKDSDDSFDRSLRLRRSMKRMEAFDNPQLPESMSGDPKNVSRSEEDVNLIKTMACEESNVALLSSSIPTSTGVSFLSRLMKKFKLKRSENSEVSVTDATAMDSKYWEKNKHHLPTRNKKKKSGYLAKKKQKALGNVKKKQNLKVRSKIEKAAWKAFCEIVPPSSTANMEKKTTDEMIEAYQDSWKPLGDLRYQMAWHQQQADSKKKSGGGKKSEKFVSQTP